MFGSPGKGTGPWVSHCDARVPVKNFSVLRHSVLGKDVSRAGRRGAISLGQKVVGQEVSGAGRRGAERRGAGRHWGNILGAERRGAGG